MFNIFILMNTNLIKSLNTKKSKPTSTAGRATVPQSCPLDGTQVLNHAGGFVWKLSNLEHANRYLIMGAKDNGNYYQTGDQVSQECNVAIIRLILSQNSTDYEKLCQMLEDISVRGLAAHQEPTLLSLAAAIVFAPTEERKAMALALVRKCIRIPTHAFMLAGYVTDLSQCKPGTKKGKGWGSGFRKALSQFYTSRKGLDLAMLVTKYKNREGWCHKDLLSMLHIHPEMLKDDGARLVFKFIFACARGEKNFIHKLLADIVSAKTCEQTTQLLNTSIPSTKKDEKDTTSAKTTAPAKGIIAGFKAVIQSVFGEKTKEKVKNTQINFSASSQSKVEIATSAFDWKRMPMKLLPTGEFTISLKLPLGTHDFKFIVDDVWQCDQSKPMHKTKEHENNYIVISEKAQQESESSQCSPPHELIATAKYLQAVLEIEDCTTSVTDISKAITLVRTHGLVREQIPTHLLNCSDIWNELLTSKGANGKQAGMPLEALTRNLGKLSSLQGFMSQANTSTICARLSSEDDIQRSRIHPFNVLVASTIYGAGKALKGALSWPVFLQVRDTLTTTFLSSFKNVAPTGKRFMVALDVSGSMSTPCMGCPAISCRQGSAALALMLYETEHCVYMRGFSALTKSSYYSELESHRGFYNFDSRIKHGMKLQEFILATDVPFGPTDCSLPMLRAISENLDVDVFIVMTDCETYAGDVHPQVALEKYRKHAKKPDAKLIVVGMTANSLTIADPNDRNTLNLSGFNAAMPEIIAMFVRGEL